MLKNLKAPTGGCDAGLKTQQTDNLFDGAVLPLPGLDQGGHLDTVGPFNIDTFNSQNIQIVAQIPQQQGPDMGFRISMANDADRIVNLELGIAKWLQVYDPHQRAQ